MKHPEREEVCLSDSSARFDSDMSITVGELTELVLLKGRVPILIALERFDIERERIPSPSPDVGCNELIITVAV